MARLSNSAPAAGTKRPRRVSNTLTFTTAQPHPPAKKQKKAPTTTTRAAATKKPSPWYTARAILDEDACRYLIDWEAGDDGTLFAATWEPKRNANAALVKEWKDDKRSEAKGKPKGRKEKATKPAAAVDAGVSSAKTEETEAAADAGVASTKKGKARKRAVPKSSTVQAPAVQEPAKADPAVFSVREIVAERKGVYRVAWEPDATTGEVYEDTWEPKGHVSQDLVQAWKKTRKERMQQNKQRKEQQGRQQEGQTQQQEQELPLSRPSAAFDEPSTPHAPDEEDEEEEEEDETAPNEATPSVVVGHAVIQNNGTLAAPDTEKKKESIVSRAVQMVQSSLEKASPFWSPTSRPRHKTIAQYGSKRPPIAMRWQ